MNASEVLEQTAVLLETNGWKSLTGDFPSEGHCVSNAISKVSTPGSRVWFKAHGCLCDELGLPKDTLIPLFGWNDEQTDPGVVVDCLRHAAKRALEDETADV